MNLFFLLNIIRVLVTKLRDTHRAESNMYMKAVRATLILVPLLGIQFVIFPWRPENRLAGEVYEYIMHILMHYQVGSELTARHEINQKYQVWGSVQRKFSREYHRTGKCSFSAASVGLKHILTIPNKQNYLYAHD